MESRLKAAVVGATGYTGAEACRLLLGHPSVGLAYATSERQAGRPLAEACPWLATDLALTAPQDSYDTDVVFLCQESGAAMRTLPGLLARSKVIDLSADFRIKDLAAYEEWYGSPHTSPGLEPWPVYGLPELVDKLEIANASAVANPGCYVTASLLALAPLVRAGLVSGVPVIDAKSGVSGAGRSRTETDYLLSELHGAMKPYKTTGHRHTVEIEQTLGCKVRFTPHLLPVSRGICATIHVSSSAGKEQIYAAWQEFYASGPFVRTSPEPPSTKLVHGTNGCVLYADKDERTGHAVLVSVIDNLGKGAAGQAVQNMNLMFGLPEDAGLTASGVWP